MAKMSWAAYGLGVVVVVVLVLMSSEVGVLLKSIVVAGTLFVGAVVAALNEIAQALGARSAEPLPTRRPAEAPRTRERA
ncbi:hypothetical protein SCB71_16130 [Herbiconiux sp. KACC 21604]|uniref:hypothetical protein n=1 Tax=unclassified Herbiconiux TaxID=2618217 RepID=UPI001492F759|nr:hypothetical protein [Herbiconiux sp. SALV-R1]QJU54637.1 hypothetical protein HL652_14090 [Herbiconiux sp. SALV-R1]WPO85733.1 hypothetical protein SCB71_16130 [Herbiconiux sp. KACC 21604]